MHMWPTSAGGTGGSCVLRNDQGIVWANTVDVRHLLLGGLIQAYRFDSLFEPILAYISNTQWPNVKKNITLETTVSPEIKYIQEIKGKILARPLELRIAYESGHVFVENEELNLWGEGASLEEAEESFERFFFHELKVYKNTPTRKMDHSAREKYKAYKILLKIR